MMNMQEYMDKINKITFMKSKIDSIHSIMNIILAQEEYGIVSEEVASASINIYNETLVSYLLSLTKLQDDLIERGMKNYG